MSCAQITGSGDLETRCRSCQQGPTSNDCCVEVLGGAGCPVNTFCCKNSNGASMPFQCLSSCPVN